MRVPWNSRRELFTVCSCLCELFIVCSCELMDNFARSRKHTMNMNCKSSPCVPVLSDQVSSQSSRTTRSFLSTFAIIFRSSANKKTLYNGPLDYLFSEKVIFSSLFVLVGKETVSFGNAFSWLNCVTKLMRDLQDVDCRYASRA